MSSVVAFGPFTTYPQDGPFVIRERTAWELFWRHLPTRQPAPDIDFERFTLLVLVAEAGPHAIRPEVEDIEQSGTALIVHWRSGQVPHSWRSEGRPHLRPFTVVGTESHDGPISFQQVR